MAVKAMRVPVENPDMKRAMNNVCIFCVILNFAMHSLIAYVMSASSTAASDLAKSGQPIYCSAIWRHR